MERESEVKQPKKKGHRGFNWHFSMATRTLFSFSILFVVASFLVGNALSLSLSARSARSQTLGERVSKRTQIDLHGRWRGVTLSISLSQLSTLSHAYTHLAPSLEGFEEAAVEAIEWRRERFGVRVSEGERRKRRSKSQEARE